MTTLTLPTPEDVAQYCALAERTVADVDAAEDYDRTGNATTYGRAAGVRIAIDYEDGVRLAVYIDGSTASAGYGQWFAWTGDQWEADEDLETVLEAQPAGVWARLLAQYGYQVATDVRLAPTLAPSERYELHGADAVDDEEYDDLRRAGLL